jgi:hypothetical protein
MVGEITVATIVRVDPYFKRGPDINFDYNYKGYKIKASNQLENELDISLILGGQFLIRYMPRRKLITEFLRDNNGRIIMFKGSSPIDLLNKIQ